MGEHSTRGRHERSTMAAHGLISGNVFHQHFLRFFRQRDLHMVNTLRRNGFKDLLHTADRPEKIDSSRTSLANCPANMSEFSTQSRNVRRRGRLSAEWGPHCTATP